jgi:hypothetical protein
MRGVPFLVRPGGSGGLLTTRRLDKSFRSYQKAPVFIGRAVSVVNVASRLLDQIPVSLEYIVVAPMKADFPDREMHRGSLYTPLAAHRPRS